MGKDHTLFAKIAGRVQFGVKGRDPNQVVSVIPVQ